jgi:hypothetical protein
VAGIDAEIQAKKQAEAAEREPKMTPSLMTDDELLGQFKATQDLHAVSERITAGLAAEMARRGLA